MYPVSAQFLATLRASHTVTARVEVLDRGQIVAALGGTSGLGRVTGGGVSLEANAGVSRKASVDLSDPGGALTPAGYADLLAPSGNEMRLWRGVQKGSFAEEVPIFTGLIGDVTVESGSAGGVNISLSGMDRADRVSEAGFDTTYVISAGQNYADAIRVLINSRLDGLTFRFTTTGALTPLLIFQPDDDPWEMAQKMSQSIGCRLYFDGMGVCILEPVGDSSTAPVSFSYAEGAEAVILSASKKLSRQYTYNGVVASGETTSIGDQATAPVTWTAWDTNLSSPTYYQGKFGRKPRRYASPFITTPTQARSAAEAILNDALGLSEEVRFTAVVNPAHVPGDVIEIVVSDSRIAARYVMDSFSIPLLHSANMDATTRRRAA